MGHSLRLADILGGLSIVADLGFGLPSEEAMRSCLIGTALARELGAAEPEVADTFYASLLVHIGCTAFSHETAAVFGDELQNTAAVARTNFADSREVLTRFVPEATRGMSAPSRVRAAMFIVVKGSAFGKRYETASCEVARATARRIALPDGVQRSVYEVHEWWNGTGAPKGLTGTAGVWRASAIETAGGWRAASLVEDCELSFRHLFAGYRTKGPAEALDPGLGAAPAAAPEDAAIRVPVLPA